VAPAGRDPVEGPPPLQAICHNITMAQFGEQLPHIAPPYLDRPVADSTGLEGTWDFTLTFSLVPPGQGAAGGGRKGGGPPPAPRESGMAADPSGVMSLFEAMDKQLGIKMEMVKRSLPVMVIDHVEQKPADN
jgi:uncharacterized protein (TIGR03435 family)